MSVDTMCIWMGCAGVSACAATATGAAGGRVRRASAVPAAPEQRPAARGRRLGRFQVCVCMYMYMCMYVRIATCQCGASRLLPMLACGPDLPVADEEAGLRRVRAVSVDLLRRQASRGTWKVGSFAAGMYRRAIHG